LGAQAFTHGSDVYFGAGKEPGNNELTAHELTHVVQQTGEIQNQQIANQPTVNLKCSACEEEEQKLQSFPEESFMPQVIQRQNGGNNQNNPQGYTEADENDAKQLNGLAMFDMLPKLAGMKDRLEAIRKAAEAKEPRQNKLLIYLTIEKELVGQ